MQKNFLAHFWFIFTVLGVKKFFSPNYGSVTHNFLAQCQSLEKNNDAIPRKCRMEDDRHKDGKTDIPYFIGPFQLLP